MGFELQVHPSPADAKPQQPLQTFRSLPFSDCHSKDCPCWRNTRDEGPDSEIFDSEHHQLTSLERYLACQWTRVFSGHQGIVTCPVANLLAKALHINAFLHTHTHTLYKWQLLQSFFIFLWKMLPSPPKDLITSLKCYQFFTVKCSWQEKVRRTDGSGSIFRSSIHSPNSAFVTVTAYLPINFRKARPRLYSPWKSHHANIGKHLKIFTTGQ